MVKVPVAVPDACAPAGFCAVFFEIVVSSFFSAPCAMFKHKNIMNNVINVIALFIFIDTLPYLT
jgi:hypothetical protein